MKTVQLWWAGLCAAGTLIVALAAESNEAQCRAADGFLCFDAGIAFGLMAAMGAVVWVVVACLLWLVVTLIRR